MKVTQPAYNYQGHLLLSSGTVLSERHIKLLKAWGVVELNIEGVECRKVDRLALLNDENRQIVEKEIAFLFPCENLDEFNTELKRVAINALINNSHELKGKIY
ncbi:MAG: hypothetical protein AB2L14_32880 [Candidatus Xenobiia bacterium LiM19]